MSAIAQKSFQTSYVQEKLFALSHLQQDHQTLIEMEMYLPYFHTNAFPKTLEILKRVHPSVLNTKCYNPQNLPFSQELLNTEIGHLFEHILLAYLTDMQTERGVVNSVYNGVTKWDWIQGKEGTFQITVDIGKSDQILFSEALEKSSELLSFILESGEIISPKTKQTAN